MRDRFGVDVPRNWQADVDESPESSERVILDWLDLPLEERPTAVVVGSGATTWRSMERALATRGRRLGFGDNEIAAVGITYDDRPLMFGHGLAYKSGGDRTLAEVAASAAIALVDSRLPRPVCVQRVLPDLTEMWCFDMPFSPGGNDGPPPPLQLNIERPHVAEHLPL